MRLLLVFLVGISFLPQFALAEDCRAHLANIVCHAKGDPAYGRTCESGGEAYVEEILKAYDLAPDVLKPLFCTLKQFYVEIDFASDSWSYSPLNWMGVKKSLIDDQIDYLDYESLFDQKYFGSSTPGKVNKDLPHFVRSEITGITGTLLRLIGHEFGHILDDRYKVAAQAPGQYCEKYQIGCEFLDGSFPYFSWTTWQPMPEDFSAYGVLRDPNAQTVRDFMVNKQADRMAEGYRTLYATDLISPFALWSFEEDFAETFSLYILSKVASEVVIRIGCDEEINILSKVRDPNGPMAKKVAWIEKLLKLGVRRGS